jgi:hypothetical protein
MARANRHHLHGYIDLNMVRAGAVRHPGEWVYGGYREIQNPKQRYTLIDRQKLSALLCIKDNDQLSKWTQSIAACPVKPGFFI